MLFFVSDGVSPPEPSAAITCVSLEATVDGATAASANVGVFSAVIQFGNPARPARMARERILSEKRG